jgi:hypothetical protein
MEVAKQGSRGKGVAVAGENARLPGQICCSAAISIFSVDPDRQKPKRLPARI